MSDALPADLPLCPGFRWKTVVVRVEEGTPALVLESRFSKVVGEQDVSKFYKDELLKQAWTFFGPAGGSTSWTLSGTKEGRSFRIYFTANKDFDTLSEVSAKGTRVRIVYWASSPSLLAARSI